MAIPLTRVQVLPVTQAETLALLVVDALVLAMVIHNPESFRVAQVNLVCVMRRVRVRPFTCGQRVVVVHTSVGRGTVPLLDATRHLHPPLHPPLRRPQLRHRHRHLPQLRHRLVLLVTTTLVHAVESDRVSSIGIGTAIVQHISPTVMVRTATDVRSK